jgi:NADH-quinone oxidoreductase subunit N
MVPSGIAICCYVRVIVLTFLTEGTNDTPQVFAPGTWSKAVIAVSASVTVILGYRPVAAARFACQAARSLRWSSAVDRAKASTSRVRGGRFDSLPASTT